MSVPQAAPVSALRLGVSADTARVGSSSATTAAGLERLFDSLVTDADDQDARAACSCRAAERAVAAAEAAAERSTANVTGGSTTCGTYSSEVWSRKPSNTSQGCPPPPPDFAQKLTTSTSFARVAAT